MTKNIELTNPSKKAAPKMYRAQSGREAGRSLRKQAITYLVQLVGSSGNDFAVKEDTIKLEPRPAKLRAEEAPSRSRAILPP